MNAAARLGRGGNGRGSHQSQSLEEDDGALGRTTPNELAPLPLAVLDVDVPAGILQAAIAEGAIDKDALVQDEVLALKNLSLESIHTEILRTRLPPSAHQHSCAPPGINRSTVRTGEGYAAKGGGATRGPLNAVVDLKGSYSPESARGLTLS